MPFALVTIGLVLVITGANDTYKQLGSQLLSDFTGPANFTYWVVAIGAIGALGYFSPFKEITRYFLALVIIAMILANANPGAPGGGFFKRFKDALSQGPQKSANAAGSVSTPSSNSAMSGSDALRLGDALLTASTALL